MLELGQSSGAAGDLIKDGSEATFMADVVEASKEVPVIVDFWAPWCSPCKTLGPALEAEVTAAGGKVKMVKINIDENQGIASQLQIQSIPTVYVFWEGKPADGFQGAQPASKLKEFIDKAIQNSGGEEEGLSAAVEAAQTMLEDGDFEDAAQTFAAVLEEEPANPAAYGGLVAAHIGLDDLEQAEAVLNGAPLEITQLPEIETVHAQLELAKQAADAGPVGDLRAALAANEDDHQTRLDLATALHGSGDAQGAVDELLELFRRDREWNDGAAKAQLFTVFDALKPDDPVVLNGRRKLTSMIFV